MRGWKSAGLTGALLKCSLVCCLMYSDVAAAADLSTGTVCKITDTIGMTAKKGRGKKKRYRKNTIVEIIEAGGTHTRVRVGNKRGYMKTAWLSKICNPIGTPTPAPELAPEDEPALVPLEAVPDDVTQIPGTDTPPPELPPESPTDLGSEAFGETFKIKMAVMDLNSTADSFEKSFLASLTNHVSQTLDRLGPFKAISTQDVVQMLNFEAQKQMVGCDQESCLSEIGGALGADFLVSGTVIKAEDVTLFQLQLINIRDSRVENRVSTEYAGGTSGMFDAIEGATKQLVREILGARSGKLKVAVSEEGATIRVDGSIVGVSPLQSSLVVSGGNHALTVEKEGFVVYRKDVDILDSEETPVQVLLTPSADYIQAYERDATKIHRFGLASTIVGVGGLVGAAVLYVGTKSKADALDRDIRAYNERTTQTTEEFQRLQSREKKLARQDLGVLIAGGVGLVGVTAGILMLSLGDDPDRYDAVTRTGVSVGIGPGFLSIGGDF